MGLVGPVWSSKLQAVNPRVGLFSTGHLLTRPNVARTVGQFIIDAFDERPVKI